MACRRWPNRLWTPPTGDRLARRNAVVLSVAQALAGGNNTVLVATAGIVGSMLAPDKGLATLPISVFVFGMWISTLPMGWLARNLGRRTALQIGTVSGILTGLICCVAVLQGSFLLFNIGAIFSGFYAAAHQSYRFAAADTASDAFKAKAISWVLVGGVFGAVVGPQLVIATKDLWQPYLFAASYIAQSLFALAAGGVLMLLKIPRLPPRTATSEGRPLSEIARQPRFLVAVACGVVSYSMMNLVMTSAPLAMVMCNHSITDATLGLQWHILGMFAPSFVTGALINRFGILPITGLGLSLLIVAAVIGITGISLWHFWIGLAVLGVGWNFAFIGATTMVTAVPPTQRAQQSAGLQRLPDLRHDGDRLVLVGQTAGQFRLGDRQRGLDSVRPCRLRAADLVVTAGASPV